MKIRKAFLIYSAVLLLTIATTIGIGEANPEPVSSYPPTPDTDLPTLTIKLPESPSALNDNKTVALYIALAQPDNWSYGINPRVGFCRGYVYVDGIIKFTSLYARPNDYVISFTGCPNATLKIEDADVYCNDLTGSHAIQIDIVSTAFSQIGIYTCNMTQTVNFKIDSASQTISFSQTSLKAIKGSYPTAPLNSSPTSSSHVTPSNSPDSQSISPKTTDVVIGAAVGLIVAGTIILATTIIMRHNKHAKTAKQNKPSN
jgi:hypothetical protein